MTYASPYSVPEAPGRWRAVALAAVVHVALFFLLWFGVRWQNQTPIAIEAEVWSIQAKEAAPPSPSELPSPPKETRKEVAKKEAEQYAKPQPVAPPAMNPDIALRMIKKRKEQQLAEEDARKAKLRAEQLRVEKEHEKEKADAIAKKLRAADELKKQLAEKKRNDDLENQRLADARDEEMRRLTGSVATTSGTGGVGNGAKSQGSRGTAEYAARVGAKIKSNTIFNVPENLQGNPFVEFAVELLPDGSVRKPIRKIKSSGIPGFDEAVFNAIEKSQPFPPDKSGMVPAHINLVHRPKDQ